MPLILLGLLSAGSLGSWLGWKANDVYEDPLTQMSYPIQNPAPNYVDALKIIAFMMAIYFAFRIYQTAK